MRRSIATGLVSFIALTLAASTLALSTYTARGADSPARAERWMTTPDRQGAASALAANDIVYDRFRDRIYASVAGTQPALGSIVTFHRDGRIGTPLVVGSNPNVLALSADGQFLYVGLDGSGAVRRIALDTMTPEPPWLIGNDPTCTIFTPADMVVLSDDPRRVVVARANPCRQSHAGVAVYENGSMQPATTLPLLGNDVIEPSAVPARLSGLDRDSTGRDLRRLSVNAAGVTETMAAAGVLTVFAEDMLYDRGRLYTTGGDVVADADFTLSGHFDVANNSLPVVRDGRAFFLSYDPTQGQYELQVYDAATFEFLAATTVAGLVDSQPGKPVDFIDTGPGSMGVRLGDGTVYWLNIRLVQFTSMMPFIGGGRRTNAN
jgi:DNA-binding beta-propeller fold protein YncE